MASKRPFPSFLVFKDQKGHWRWNYAAGNGKVVAASSVAYLRRPGCIRAIQMMKGSATIPVVGRPRDLEPAPEAAAGGPEIEKAGAEETKAKGKGKAS